MHKHRILFICCKRKQYYLDETPETPDKVFSSGLGNSVTFLVEMLLGLGIEAKRAEVIDNNDIDREVTRYQPTDCFIEAFWVVPSKFDVLQRLHPNVRFIVRDHSAVPFLSMEGIALEWIGGYLERGIEVNCNSLAAYHELKIIAHQFQATSDRLVSFLPNYYPAPGPVRPSSPPPYNLVRIGCFGAIRALKNQLEQAVAACAFADNQSLRLEFHINASRQEGAGAQPILKNLRHLFSRSRHRLVEHPWMPHADFLALMASMNLALQVSFSETFNIVAADAVASGVPVIVSPQVSWLGNYARAIPGEARTIVHALERAWSQSPMQRVYRQVRDLSEYLRKSENLWEERFG